MRLPRGAPCSGDTTSHLRAGRGTAATMDLGAGWTERIDTRTANVLLEWRQDEPRSKRYRNGSEMRTEWQDPEDTTACPNRVPSMHDWRKSMPYISLGGERGHLWLCSACPAFAATVSPSLTTGTRPT